jgi:energy-coupling factor transport system ATP-binding protein
LTGDFVTSSRSVDLAAPSLREDRRAPVLAVCNLTDQQIACSRVSPLNFDLAGGEVLGIAGDNGSGKSTLLELLSGIKKTEAGSILWDNVPLKKMKDRKKIMTICNVSCTQQFLSSTVREELALCIGNWQNSAAKAIVELFQLGQLLGRKIHALSFGQKQRLAIVLAMLSDVKILLFDEPTYGMDNEAFHAFVQSLQLLAAAGKIACVASHDAVLLNAVATKTINLSAFAENPECKLEDECGRYHTHKLVEAS